ncbi:TetR/AcrR family transcriptional regulator [Rhodococcus triatomae]|uniref:DNA-binding transcriptional regulator, AcrR family n=1 Tax=Rhodococcus triatomae TaxID=300028 RepID=A0A1G7Z8G0_9NOCA|nr:TetR/AcrR family transcriptional regulator [Rhodococcus triatomae]QNG18098.1 TetR/AcrR family transcriptional regulator [Rhodococcus triatomae]QNG22232.1 TetR/AcrR family transcriptional regulator [Rhodococcus triatomae]SDH04887.1 DNA-binding transcriptional regulator, AcrR family [Rhodococcus triatomae]
MDVAKRTRLSPEQRKEQFIELGAQMLTERNLESISVEDIADQAGVSRGLLYNYFASKHDFHIAIVQRTSDELLSQTDPGVVARGVEEPFGLLHAVLESYVDYVTDNSNGYISLLRGTASGDADMRAVFERTRTEMSARILDHLPLLGIERSAHVELAVRGWIAFVEEATITWLRAPSIEREQLIRMHVQALPALAVASSPELAATLAAWSA